MRPRWTTTAPPTGNGRWLTSRLCALGLMVEEDDAAEILGRASYAGFSPEAGASAIAATNIVLDRGQIREEIRGGCHQRYFRACRARGYETWTVTTFGGSDNRLPVANGITGIVMPSAMHCRRSCQGIHFCSGDGRSDRNHGGSGIEPGLK